MAVCLTLDCTSLTKMHCKCVCVANPHVWMLDHVKTSWALMLKVPFSRLCPTHFDIYVGFKSYLNAGVSSSVSFFKYSTVKNKTPAQLQSWPRKKKKNIYLQIITELTLQQWHQVSVALCRMQFHAPDVIAITETGFVYWCNFCKLWVD